MQIAAQCGSADTYHVHTLDLIVEHLMKTVIRAARTSRELDLNAPPSGPNAANSLPGWRYRYKGRGQIIVSAGEATISWVLSRDAIQILLLHPLVIA